MAIIDWIRNNHYTGPVAKRLASSWRSWRRAEPWKSELEFGLWADQINSEKYERVAGVQTKIEQITTRGRVFVVGGKITGGNDSVFLCNPVEGTARLLSLMVDIPADDYLIIYAPHPFWARLFGGDYTWIPSWEDLYWLIYSMPGWRIVQYSSSFDASGRYFILAKKTPRERDLLSCAELGRKTYRVFYFQEGADLTLSRSNYALSAHLCAALARTGAYVYAYDMNDVAALNRAHYDDILIGHVGHWVKEAYQRGFKHIVLFFPVNRWYPTRQSDYFEANATIEEQVKLCDLVIAQSGAVWRMTGDYPHPEKWRWIDLGVDPAQFPLVKHTFAPPGKRKFFCFHLYDSEQKGADIAEQIIRAKPQDRFWWVSGRQVRSANVHYRASINNTSLRFRQIAQDCDFVILPSREDAQAGTLVEAMSLGLLPMASYNSGYSLSFPTLIEPNCIDTWLRAIDEVQQIDTCALYTAQNIMRHYLDTVHAWRLVEQQIIFYLRELSVIKDL